MKISNCVAIIATFIVVVGIFYLIFDLPKHKIPEGKVLVNESYVDSLEHYMNLADSLDIIASLPPDTIYGDTVYILNEQVATTAPEPIETPDSLTQYNDSLVIPEKIDAHISFQTTGKLVTPVFWRYTPIVRETEVIIEKKVPVLIFETLETEVRKYYSGHYLSAAASGNDKMFIFGIDYDFVQEKYVAGFQYRKYGSSNIYGVKAGINLNALFKKDRKWILR
jgi:hypothetical protein